MDTGLVLARFLHFASTMSLFGTTFFATCLAPASVRFDLSPLLQRLTPPLAVISLASATAWFYFVAREMAGDDFNLATLRDVALGTSFGVVWLARGVLLTLLLLATLRPDRCWRVSAILAGLAVASLGLVGHAAMQDGALGVAHRANHAGHLLAASGWFGGLPIFFLCLLRFVQAPSGSDALTAMMRFSSVGHFMVATVLATGAVNIAMTTHGWPWPPDSPYRQMLCAKIAIVAAMVALALFNRYVLASKAGRSSAAARALAAAAVAEIALALAAIALVSSFAILDPA